MSSAPTLVIAALKSATGYPLDTMQALSKLLESVVAEMYRSAEAPTEKSVHDLRVSVNRATAALRIFESEIPHARRLRKKLKQMRKRAAAVRDRDVIRQLLLRHRLSSSDPACIYLLGQRDLAAEQLQTFLRIQLERELLPSLEKVDRNPRIRIEAPIREFLAHGRIAAESINVAELHSFRKAAKRLRYTIEILDPDGGSKWLARLRRVQEELGQMQDANVTEQFLRALPSRSRSAKLIPAQLNAKAQAHIAAFRKTWKRGFSEGSGKAWLSWVSSIEQ